VIGISQKNDFILFRRSLLSQSFSKFNGSKPPFP
jgi:hypothetical protein